MLARKLIAETWPQLEPLELEMLDAGWDNTVYRVNKGLVFRFPRREVARSLLETELKVLPWLAPKLAVLIPVPRYRGEPSPTYPSVFAGYEFLPGTTLHRGGWNDGQKATLARPLGRFLAQLHAISVADASAVGVPIGDPIRKLDFGRYRAVIAAAIEPLVRTHVVDAVWPRLIDDRLARIRHVDEPSTDTLVHGDFHGSQILVAKGKLSGVIDWGDVHCGDPALDLAAVHALLAQSAHDGFFSEYGPVSAARWEVARGRAIVLEFWGLAHAADVADPVILSECRRSLGRLLESQS